MACIRERSRKAIPLVAQHDDEAPQGISKCVCCVQFDGSRDRPRRFMDGVLRIRRQLNKQGVAVSASRTARMSMRRISSLLATYFSTQLSHRGGLVVARSEGRGSGGSGIGDDGENALAALHQNATQRHGFTGGESQRHLRDAIGIDGDGSGARDAVHGQLQSARWVGIGGAIEGNELRNFALNHGGCAARNREGVMRRECSRGTGFGDLLQSSVLRPARVVQLQLAITAGDKAHVTGQCQCLVR